MGRALRRERLGEDVALPGGLPDFFTLEYCIFRGVPEAVLAARSRLIKLPVPTLVGGVSVAIVGFDLDC